MKIGIILETSEPEKAWNGMRFANTALSHGHEVRLFLMSAGVEAESITHDRFNVRDQLHAFIEKTASSLPAALASKAEIRPKRRLAPFRR